MWPEIWSSKGTVKRFQQNREPQDPPENFNVFVNEKESFLSNLPKLKIKNIQNKFFAFDNPYFVSCCAAYTATYLCGISTKHFQDKTSNLISSMHCKVSFLLSYGKIPKNTRETQTTHYRQTD